MDRSNLKDQEKPPTAPPRPHHSITTGPTQLPPSPNTRQPAQPSAVTASPTIRPSPQATPKDTSHLVETSEWQPLTGTLDEHLLDKAPAVPSTT